MKDEFKVLAKQINMADERNDIQTYCRLSNIYFQEFERDFGEDERFSKDQIKTAAAISLLNNIWEL